MNPHQVWRTINERGHEDEARVSGLALLGDQALVPEHLLPGRDLLLNFPAFVEVKNFQIVFLNINERDAGAAEAEGGLGAMVTEQALRVAQLQLEVRLLTGPQKSSLEELEV